MKSADPLFKRKHVFNCAANSARFFSKNTSFGNQQRLAILDIDNKTKEEFKMDRELSFV